MGRKFAKVVDKRDKEKNKKKPTTFKISWIVSIDWWVFPACKDADYMGRTTQHL